LKKIHKYLSEEISGLSISIFRILLGFILFLQSLYWVLAGFIQKNILEPTFLFPFIEDLNPLPNFLMNFGVNGALLIGAFFIITNRFYKIGLILYLFSFTYLWLLCQGFFNNHYYLISIICFLLIFSKTPFSKTEKIRIPRLYLFLLQLLIVTVYIVAGVNKLNPYWLIDTQPMTHILSEVGLSEKSFFIPMFSYLGLFFDLLIGPVLLLKRTRLIGIIVAFLFHLMNFIIFLLAGGEIGFFPFIMIITLILFLDPNQIELKHFVPNARLLSRQNYNKTIASILLVFLCLQIILPFRHVFFKGYVDYNGIGQRFSWRLKNMYKEPKTEGLAKFIVLTSTNDTVSTFNLFNVDQADIILTDRQRTNLIYYPNIIPLFAKKTEKELKRKIKEANKELKNKEFDLIIKATCEISFMGRKSELLFNPDIDLTNISHSTCKTNTWLFPLKQKPWDFE